MKIKLVDSLLSYKRNKTELLAGCSGEMQDQTLLGRGHQCHLSLQHHWTKLMQGEQYVGVDAGENSQPGLVLTKTDVPTPHRIYNLKWRLVNVSLLHQGHHLRSALVPA